MIWRPTSRSPCWLLLLLVNFATACGLFSVDNRPSARDGPRKTVRVCHVPVLTTYHVRTAVARIVRARALKVRGTGLAWGEVTPFPVTRRAGSHCTCCGSTQAFPARSRMMMSAPPLPNPRSRQERKARASCAERLEQRKAHDIFDIPTNKRQCAQVIGEGCTCRRPGAQRLRVRRRARSARWQPGCRRRMGVARSATRRWQPTLRL